MPSLSLDFRICKTGSPYLSQRLKRGAECSVQVSAGAAQGEAPTAPNPSLRHGGCPQRLSDFQGPASVSQSPWGGVQRYLCCEITRPAAASVIPASGERATELTASHFHTLILQPLFHGARELSKGPFTQADKGYAQGMSLLPLSSGT